MMRTVALLALYVLSANAYMQAFVVREAKGPNSPFLSRELGGKNHIAPQNAMKNENADLSLGEAANAGQDMRPLSLKPGQAIVPRERPDGKMNFIKPGLVFETQSIFMSPPQRAAWSVTPEQHGAAK